MTLHSIIEQFDVLMDAPDSVSKLRQFILQLAVQGKLTKQDPSDEPAEQLLERIQAEKQRLYEAGEIRKPKTFDPVGTDDELFSLPSNWVWTRLGEIRRGWGQKEPSRRFSYIDVSSINKEDGIISDEFEEIAPEDAPSRARKVVRPGTVLYSSVRPYLLNIAIVDREFDPQPIASTAFMIMHPLGGLSERYLYYYLRSKPLSEYVGQQMVGMAYPAVSKTKFMPAPFPLPPLEEQHRIVATVDRLMEACDTLEAQQEAAARVRVRCTEAATQALQTADTPADVRTAWHRLRDHFATLTATPDAVDAVRQTILQLAVQGKLTEQDPSDEPAEELLERIQEEKQRLYEAGEIRKSKDLPSITDETVPFELPDGWTWTRIAEICNLENGDRSKNYPKRSELVDSGIPFINAGHLQDGEIDFTDMNYIPEQRFELLRSGKVTEGDVLFCLRGSLGKCAITGGIDRGAIASSLVIVRPLLEFVSNYLLMYFGSALCEQMIDHYDNGTAQPNLGSSSLAEFLIPLPPLAEQQRIVATVDRLMEQCDTLEAQLEQEQALGEELLEAVLHRAARGEKQPAMQEAMTVE